MFGRPKVQVSAADLAAVWKKKNNRNLFLSTVSLI